MEKKYKKPFGRLSIKFMDGNSKKHLFEITNKHWVDVGEYLSDIYVNELVKQTIKEENLPEKVKVIIECDYLLT